MCVQTQLAPNRQTVQVGETSTIKRGCPERALNRERSCAISRRSVSDRDRAGAGAAEELGGVARSELCFSLAQLAAASATTASATARLSFVDRVRDRAPRG